MSAHLCTEKLFWPSLVTTVSGSNDPGGGAQHGGGTRSGFTRFTMLCMKECLVRVTGLSFGSSSGHLHVPAQKFAL